MAEKKSKVSIEELEKQLAPKEPDYLPTGLISIDMMFKGRGIPTGSFLVLYSGSGFGKSTSSLSLCKSMADQGYKSLYAASESSTQLMEDMGLLGESYKGKFTPLDLTTYDELENIFNAFLDSDYTVLVVDSITACIQSNVASGSEGTQDQQPASDSRIRSQLMKYMQGMMKKTDKVMICIAQTRANFNKGWLGPDTTAEGGYAQKFYCTAQFEMRGDAQVADITSDSKAKIGKIGYWIADKNRYCDPLVPIPVQVLFGKGISNIYSALHYLYWKGAITSSGATFKIEWNGNTESVKGRVGRNEWVKTHINEIVKDLKDNSAAYYKALADGFKVTI